MKRIGLYSGKIYDGDEGKNAKECCRCLTDYEAKKIEEDKDEYDLFFGVLHSRANCNACGGCPASRGEME